MDNTHIQDRGYRYMSQNNLQLRKNHKFLSSTSDIRQICDPLKLLQINMFVYRKRFADGSEIYLSTHANWIDDYFKLGLYKSSIFEGDISRYPTGFLVWPKESELDVFRHGQVYYNSVSGITFCKNNHDTCDLFFFSSTEKPSHLGDYYLYNLDLFQKFVVYFQEKASELIKNCDSHRVKPPPFVIHSAVELYLNEISNNTNNPQREAFVNAIQHNRSSYRKSQFSILTQREHDCLDLLMREHNLVKIAKILGISHRTAETHFQHIKEKLQCRNKTELLLKVQKILIESN